MGTYVLHRPYQTCIFTGAGHSFAVRLILKISKNLEYAYVYNGSFTVTNHGLPLRMHGARTYGPVQKSSRACVSLHKLWPLRLARDTTHCCQLLCLHSDRLVPARGRPGLCTYVVWKRRVTRPRPKANTLASFFFFCEKTTYHSPACGRRGHRGRRVRFDHSRSVDCHFASQGRGERATAVRNCVRTYKCMHGTRAHVQGLVHRIRDRCMQSTPRAASFHRPRLRTTARSIRSGI